jgi:UDP-N-acetylglucosamine acyltransferase
VGALLFWGIGELALIGGMSVVDCVVFPFTALLGARGDLAGLNIFGLKRRAFSREAIHSLRAAYRALFFGRGTQAERVDALEQDFADDENVQKIVAFIRAGGKRRLTQPRAGAGDMEP